MFDFFNTLFLVIRLGSISRFIQGGNKKQAIKILDNTIEHLEERPSDIIDDIKGDVLQELLMAVSLLHCDVEPTQQLMNIRELIQKNKWYTSNCRWENLMAARVIKNACNTESIGDLAQLPDGILYMIGKQIKNI